MPYITRDYREDYQEALERLSDELFKCSEEVLGAHLNYCVSYILNRLLEWEESYVRANTIRGAIENAISEWYRTQVAPNEDAKLAANGPV